VVAVGGFSRVGDGCSRGELFAEHLYCLVDRKLQSVSLVLNTHTKSEKLRRDDVMSSVPFFFGRSVTVDVIERSNANYASDRRRPRPARSTARPRIEV
jgi:hypothetical protein